METTDKYNPQNHVGDTLDTENGCISLRTFILGEIKIYEREFSPKYEVIFYPNSWAYANGLRRKKATYYDKNDAFTCQEAMKRQSINEFNQG